ncbi:MAG: hypothetical protein KC964_01535 [Candidatus Omnitrophica bacterium]|nr:hypothetical protein [Candidatus Omnitrophota bacterium]
MLCVFVTTDAVGGDTAPREADAVQPFYDFTSQAAFDADLPVIEPTGYFALGRRYIHPPRVDWVPVEGADRYRLTLTQSGEVLGAEEAQAPPHYLKAGWDRIRPLTPGQITIEGLDGSGARVALSRMFPLYVAPDYDANRTPKKGRSYSDAAWAAFRALTEFELPSDAEIPEAGLPGEIHPVLRSAAVIPPGRAHNRAFPALHDGTHAMMLEGLMKIADESDLPELRTYARSVGDHLLLCRIAEPDYVWRNMIWSAVDLGCAPALGVPGAQGELREKLGRAVDVAKCGYAAEGLVIVYEITGDKRYLDAAKEMAELYVKHQLDDGSWVARADAQTGEVLTEYGTSVGAPVAFLNRLNQVLPDQRWSQARDKAVQWMFDNPMRTFAWFTNYDDCHANVTKANPFAGASPSNFDLLFFVRYLCENPEQAPENFEQIIRENLDWNDNHFVWYGTDPLLPYDPFYPCVGEQGFPNTFRQPGNCWVPMEGHTANWGLAYLELHKFSGNARDLEMARAAANVLTQYQLDNGRLPTFLGDQHFGTGVNWRMVPGNAIFWNAGWALSAWFWAELSNVVGED